MYETVFSGKGFQFVFFYLKVGATSTWGVHLMSCRKMSFGQSTSIKDTEFFLQILEVCCGILWISVQTRDACWRQWSNFWKNASSPFTPSASLGKKTVVCIETLLLGGARGNCSDVKSDENLVSPVKMDSMYSGKVMGKCFAWECRVDKPLNSHSYCQKNIQWSETKIMLSLLLRGKLTRTQVKSEGQGGFSCRHFNWIKFRLFRGCRFSVLLWCS